MDAFGLIRNICRSILPSEDDFEDTKKVDENFRNTIKNIPFDLPRSSLTAVSTLLAAELGCPQTPNSGPKSARKIEDDRLV